MTNEIVISTLGHLIDEGYGLWLYCDNPPGCGRQLDADVYDLAEQFGRDTVYVGKRWPVKCSRCGSRQISMTLQTETRPPDEVRRDGLRNMRSTRTEDERAKALAMIAPEARAQFGI